MNSAKVVPILSHPVEILMRLGFATICITRESGAQEVKTESAFLAKQKISHCGKRSPSRKNFDEQKSFRIIS